jgi:hypothetical protein
MCLDRLPRIEGVGTRPHTVFFPRRTVEARNEQPSRYQRIPIGSKLASELNILSKRESMNIKTSTEKYHGVPTPLRRVLFAILLIFSVFVRFPIHAAPGLPRSEPRELPGPNTLNAESRLRTYQSVPYGISFRYSKDYILTTGQQDLPVYWWLAGEDDGYRSQPDRVMLATVDLPHDAYPGTGFGGAFFNLSVNQKPNVGACYALLPPTEKPLNKSVINGVAFVWTSIGGVLNRGTEASEDDYVAYKNGTCYEVTLGTYDMFANAADNAPVLLPLDRSDITRRLRAILFTLKIRSTSAGDGSAYPKTRANP